MTRQILGINVQSKTQIINTTPLQRLMAKNTKSQFVEKTKHLLGGKAWSGIGRLWTNNSEKMQLQILDLKLVMTDSQLICASMDIQINKKKKN